MKEKISQLVDDELERHAAAAPLDALRLEGEVRDTWRAYHLIGDAMRESRMLSTGFAARVAAKLAEEPIAVASSRMAPLPWPRWRWFSAAACLAAVALVGWVAFGLQEGAPQIAPATAQVPPPEMAHDYLYAHQGYSPRNSLQGVAPYVRTVSGEAGARKP
ncbi:MAG: hypothetical protein EXR30_01060 [Betaproteobacteria bacterium]|nr:hypothetical protein [Betaproteobacteria bacterium]MSQ88755.1 hypothetical protein [Betaproteobacteria bacterium]